MGRLGLFLVFCCGLLTVFVYIFFFRLWLLGLILRVLLEIILDPLRKLIRVSLTTVVEGLGNLGKYSDVLVFLDYAIGRGSRLVEQSHESRDSFLDNRVILERPA